MKVSAGRGEVQANLSFSNLKLGDRIQVDIHDPVVVALVAAKYLKIIWREPGEEGMRGSAGAGDIPADGVDTGAEGLVEEADLDGTGEDQQQP